MPYQFTTESLMQVFAALSAVISIILFYRHRRIVEVRYLILLEIFVGIWSMSYALELAAPSIHTRLIWAKLSYLGIAFTPLSYFLISMAFSQNSRMILRKNLILLSVVPFLTILFVFTNDQHQLVWKEILTGKTNVTGYEHGIWFWIFVLYSYLLIFSGFLTLLRYLIKQQPKYRPQTGVLLVATLIPLAGNFMYVSGLNPYPGYDWTPVSFVISGIIFSYGVVRHKIFNLVPVARNELIDKMEDGVLVINGNGFTEDCNPSALKIFGLEKKEVINKNFSEAFSRHQFLVKAVTENHKVTVPFDINKNGITEYYHVTVSKVFSKSGKLPGFILLIHNISALKNAEKELIEKNSQLTTEMETKIKLIEDLDSFAHMVAHDLKNSLGAIYSASEVMEEHISREDRECELLHEMAALIRTSAAKTMQITQELLILATVNHENVVRNKLSMGIIFMEAEKQLREMIRKSGASIKTPEQWPESIGYGPWIEEVWVNFLSNAIKYGGTPPVITIGAERRNNMVRYWVKDNGNGIVPEEQYKLFKKYVRLSPGKGEGYGLGLSIVKRIIEKLDGQTGLQSSGLDGEGALFWFELPRVIT